MLGRSTARSFFGSLFGSHSHEPGPIETVPVVGTEVGTAIQPAGREYRSLHAKLFIKTINDGMVTVDHAYLSIFNREIIRYAVNLAAQSSRDGYTLTQWNYFHNKGKFAAIIAYLEDTK